MLKTLFKIRFRAILSMYLQVGSKKNRARGTAATVGLVLLYIFAFGTMALLFAGMAFSVGALAFSQDGGFLYFGLAFSLAFLFSIFGSVMPAKAALFEAKDNEMLLSLPIRPRDILLSRLLALGLSSLLYTLLVLLPFFVVYILLGVLGAATLSVATVLLYIPMALAVALLSLVLSSGLAYIVAAISSRLRHKNLVTVLLSVGAFLLFFALYSRLMFGVGEGAGSGELTDEMMAQMLAELVASLRATPLYYLGATVSEPHILAFVLFILVTALLVFLLVHLLSRGFTRIVSTPAAAKKAVYVERAEKRRSPTLAFALKDVRMFFSSSAYVLNGAMGAILSLLLAFFLAFKAGEIKEVATLMLSLDGEALPMGTVEHFIAPVASAVICFLASYNIITASMISLEAKTLPLLLSLPASPSVILRGKMLSQIIITLPLNLVVAAIASVALGIPPLLSVLVLLSTVAVTCFFAAFGLFINLLLPKFNWISIAAAVKQSASVFVAMMVGMLASMLFLIASVVCGILGVGLFYLIVTILLFGDLTALLLVYFSYGGSRRFRRLMEKM